MATKTMTADHKEALAQGRTEGRIVRAYLEALAEHAPKRGRQRTPETIVKRLNVIDETIGDADALTRLHMTQEKMDLEAELEAMASGAGRATLEQHERAFCEVAASYAERKGITYAAFRQRGVPAAVLRRAGIARASK